MECSTRCLIHILDFILLLTHKIYKKVDFGKMVKIKFFETFHKIVQHIIKVTVLNLRAKYQREI